MGTQNMSFFTKVDLTNVVFWIVGRGIQNWILGLMTMRDLTTGFFWTE